MPLFAGRRGWNTIIKTCTMRPRTVVPQSQLHGPFVMEAKTMEVKPKVPLWLLALLTFSGTLAMHVFVPSLPQAAIELGTPPGTMQLTVSLYIAGLAIGQLFYGPLSDRFGRRPVLMAGLALYAVSGFVAALATSSSVLIAARFAQAMGGCSGLVLGRAIVRDLATPMDAAKRLALMNLMVSVGPGAAPIVGSVIASTLGWRAVLWMLGTFGIINLLLTLKLLPETATIGAGHDAKSILLHYRHLLRSPRFVGYAVGGGCATTCMFAFIATAPFIFVEQLHRPEHEVGIYLAILISGIALGSVIASRLAGRVALNKLLVYANLVGVVAAVAFLIAALSGALSVPLVVGTMLVFTIGVGIASPMAITLAISVDPDIIGSASGLYGFTQMGVGALCTFLVSFGDNHAVAAALVLVGAGLVGQTAFLIARRH